MKKIGLCVLLVLLVGTLSAQEEYGTVGIGAFVDVLSQAATNPAGSTTTDDFSQFGVAVSIMAGDMFEILPNLGFFLDLETTDGTATFSYPYIGGGCDFLWHFIKTPHFRMGGGAGIDFSVGWQAVGGNDSDVMIISGLSAPIFAEVVMTKWLSFRATVNVFNLTVDANVWDTGTGSQSAVDVNFETIAAWNDLVLALFFRFG